MLRLHVILCQLFCRMLRIPGTVLPESIAFSISPPIRHLLISHTAPYLPPKVFHNLCFSFFLGITVVPREIESNAYEKFWRANNKHYGRCASAVIPKCVENRKSKQCHITSFPQVQDLPPCFLFSGLETFPVCRAAKK